MDAELVLEPAAPRIVARTQRTIGVDEELRHQKQRNAARAGRCIGKPRQHQMDDVVGQIMIAIGDVDLLPEDAVAAIGLPARPAP